MYKSIFTVLFCSLTFISCDPASMQKVLDTVGDAPLTNLDISNGLKEALQLGVGNSVNFLSAEDGYYKTAYKILLPEEVNGVINTLTRIKAFERLEEKMVMKINRAAEDAAKKAGPIFLDAIKGISFDDAMNILMGSDNAATQYLDQKTYNSLYSEFKPVLTNSLNKVGALDIWSDAMSMYNSIPLTKDVNTDLADHINTKALVALFDLIEEKEGGIRNNISQRSSNLLKKVFAKQD